MSNDVQITVSVRDLTGPGFNSVNRNINQLQRSANGSLGTLRGLSVQLGGVSSAAADAGSSLGGGMGMRGKAIGLAAALGTSLLPTIGALAPMLTGLAAVAGGGALAMDDLKKKAKELKKPFEEWQKVAEKAVAPHTEKAVKSLKGAMKDLTPVIETGADTFGRITEKAAKFADSPAFKGALAKNAQMGSQWVEEFAGSIGTFTQAFLDFGAKSQPALDAWDSLLGGFLDTGLPKMFDGLEQGISGSSELLGGLASFINDGLLPTLGKVAGSFAEAFGPLIGEMLEATGMALKGLGSGFEVAMEMFEPFAGLFADAIRATNDIMSVGIEVAGNLAKSLGGALLSSLLEVAGVDTSQLGNGFRGLSDWVDQNEGRIRSAFYGVADGITMMVQTGLSLLPTLWGGFRIMTEGVITALDGLVSSAAAMFGEVPGMGWLKDVNKGFDDWAEGFRGGLDDVGSGISDFVDTSQPKLDRLHLKFNVDEAEGNLASIKEKLEDPSLTKERRAKLSADKKAAEEALRTARGDLAEFDRKKAEASITANARDFFGTARKVNSAKFPKKSVPVGANRSFFDAAVGAINGSVVGSAYINVYQRRVESQNQPRFSANGNIFRSFADGGVEDHTAQIAPAGAWRVWAEPETGGEAYIPLSPSKRPRSRQIAEETVGILGGSVRWFARGGVTKAEAAARRDARGDLTVSRFGQFAGHKRSEFRSELGNPDSMRSLIDNLNQWATKIRAATHGGTERSLLRALDSTGKKLLSYEKQLTSVTKSLEGARDKLNGLKQAASQLADSVKSGILNGANITKAAGAESGRVTINTILSQMQGSASNAKEFDRALKELKKRGLSGGLLQQVAEAGIDGGGLETAQALLGASSGQLKSLNSLQGQINSAATSAGKVTADAVYKTAITMQDKLVDKLARQQSKLTSAMDKLAAAMEKMVERGFGMKAAGGIVGAASGGARGSWTMVGEHEPELVRLPFGSRVYSGPDTRRMQQQAWTSMLNTPQRGSGARYAPTPAGGHAGGGRPMVIKLQLGNSDFGEVIIDPLRKAVSTRGGLRATFGGLD
ncbi:hypothetical protein QNO09_12865 [Streptomyces sp. 378]|uniref:hypothetical protein n=1 Tax=Streptomyces sp. 378 TaxID=3049412 RepID=UPI0024C3122E|nr:hypothetical protein [Streptomyces sp. 378]MDK1344178.1 hypothetical protein [Streptomyces sp. 378]